jgi:hypothetical protein
MRYISLLLFSLLSCILISQQDLKKDFKPLKSQGTLPLIFTKPVKETIAEEIIDLNKQQDSNKTVKSNLLKVSNYAIEWEIKSGNTLINDEITVYLNEIVDVILKDQPELRKKIHVYTSKSPVVNASAYYNGTIFVDIGLLAHANNEAQVAYVLCHEITHYIKQHSVSDWIHSEKLESSAEGKSNEDVFLEKCRYSKEQESEADIFGFSLLQATNYDTKQTPGLFDILQYSHLPFENMEFKKSIFESEHFKIPESYFLKEVSPIRDNSNEDDSEHTHPNTTKRRAAVEKLVNPQSGGVKYIIGENRFSYIRDLARFEICRLYLICRDYGAALYSAYVLSQKYPDNLFLAQTISKCLYAISLNHTGYLRYNKDSHLDGPVHYLEVESYPQQLYYLINKMPDSEWNIMALNYAYRKHKQFPNDKVLGAISDSLFKTMYYVNAQLETFGDKDEIYVNVNPNKDTTSWYKNVFADLFLADKDFAAKFPKTIGHDFVMPYTPKSYHVKRFEKKMRTVENIGTVMCLKPLYLVFDAKEDQVDLDEGAAEQKNLIGAINNCAVNQNFQLVVLDPGSISASEVEKLNDYSVVNDWLNECSDGDDNERSKVPIFSSDEINDVVTRYGTSHLLRTGFAVLKGAKINRYVFFAVIYDLKENRQVFVKQSLSIGTLSKSDVQNKICDLFSELKNGTPPPAKK